MGFGVGRILAIFWRRASMGRLKGRRMHPYLSSLCGL